MTVATRFKDNQGFSGTLLCKYSKNNEYRKHSKCYIFSVRDIVFEVNDVLRIKGVHNFRAFNTPLQVFASNASFAKKVSN